MKDSYYSSMGRKSFESHKDNLSKIFKGGNFYKVPPNQRDFEWEKPLLEEFWHDLINSYDAKDKSYFFGSTIFEYNDDNNEVTIYDGQQRLAVVTILWAVIRDLLDDFKEHETAGIIQKNYISERTEKKEDIVKLTLNLRNKDFFYQCVQLPSTSKKSFDEYEKIHGKLSDTNKKIKTCYLFFKEVLNEEFNERKLDTDKKKTDFITDISEHLRDHFLIVIIEITNEEEAYMVFETVNQKRTELSVADLFKNYLIRKTKKKKDRVDVIELWKDIADTLDNKIKAFLKHYWHSKREVITDRRLFKELKKYIEKEKNKPLDLIKELKEEAKIYSALGNSDDDYWTEKDVRGLVKEFNILNVKQPFPVLVVGRKKFDDKRFKKLLTLMINFSFRYNIICNLSPNVLERKYSDIAIKIRNGEIKDISSIVSEIKKIDKYPDDKLLTDFFIGKTLKMKNKLARYILEKIELNKRSKIPVTGTTEPLKFEDFTLEHIIPQNPDAEWKEYFKKKDMSNEDVEKLTCRVGNLTLLDQPKNSFVKNEFVTKKSKKAYDVSLLKINEPLHKLKEWTEKDIEEREKYLLKEAKKVWKI